MDRYEALANAIIPQAVKDCRNAMRALKKRPSNVTAAGDVKECERFFRSRNFALLTELDGRRLLRRLREEAENQ